MNETTITYIVNNITIIVCCSVFAFALGYQIGEEIKKVLISKNKKDGY